MRVEEFPSGYRIVAPRRFHWQLFVVAAFFVALISVLPDTNGVDVKTAILFYGGFAVAVSLLRLTLRHVILVTGSEIVVRHENFGICWWTSCYMVEPTCDLTWVRARRKQSSALELSCEKHRCRFAFDISEEEAAELTALIHQRFGHILAVR